MIVCIADLLARPLLAEVTARLEEGGFVDGRATAGWHARLVKSNEQLPADDPRNAELAEKVRRAICAHGLFELAARPRTVRPVMFSRYSPGMTYGSHVDDAVMGGVRTDVSFTLFLSDPAGYEGGELVIETTGGEQAVKLEAGSMVVYPSGSLHRVEPVRSGTRLAAVGWAQSLVRDPARREILFDLDTARRSLFQQSGKTAEFDLLSKSVSNLLRLWAET
jgi:PKHD-type hydroxylase